MMRRLYYAAILLLLALVGPAGGDERAADASRKDAKAASKRHPALPPCHCLQYRLQDYPGTEEDLYCCLTHIQNCTEGEDDLWLGIPTNDYRPQICESNLCEPYAGYYKGRKKRIPGHGMALNASSAWGMVQAALQSAKTKGSKIEWEDPKYHTIQQDDIPKSLAVDAEVMIMAVPVTVNDPKSPKKTKTLHYCVQIDSAEGGVMTAADVTSIKAGTGRQLAVNYKVNGEERKGLVWLK